MKIVREPGYRTKIAVRSTREDVDPVGACVGLKGVRIQAVVRELEGEKIDILRYSLDSRSFIKNALSPAEVNQVVILDEAKKLALAIVPDAQFSLAIGKQGLNVRLANRLTDWNIDVKTETQFSEMDISAEAKRAVSALFGETGRGDPEDLRAARVFPSASWRSSERTPSRTSRASWLSAPSSLPPLTGSPRKTSRPSTRSSRRTWRSWRRSRCRQQQKRSSRKKRPQRKRVLLKRLSRKRPSLKRPRGRRRKRPRRKRMPPHSLLLPKRSLSHRPRKSPCGGDRGGRDATSVPECGTPITPDMATCPNCGVGLTFEDDADEPAEGKTPGAGGTAKGE